MMKREGRQHGMVRSYRVLPNPLNPRVDARIINRIDSPYTVGVFAKVSSKPTNHSKFTGKCGKPRCRGCHLPPTCKSKHKTKGVQKHKHLVVIDNNESDSGFLELSATLDHVSDDYMEDDDNDEGIDQVEQEKVEDGDWVLVE